MHLFKCFITRLHHSGNLLRPFDKGLDIGVCSKLTNNRRNYIDLSYWAKKKKKKNLGRAQTIF